MSQGCPAFRHTEAGALAGLGQDLHARIRAEIVSLRLAPGTQLQEVVLGQRFGTSRTPVREALQRLLRDGLVERHGRFYRVILLGREEVRELCELREALECMAVALAVQRDAETPLALSALVAAQEQAAARRDLDAFNELDGAFHLRIAEGAGNRQLCRQIEALHDRVALVRGMEHRRPLWEDRVIAEHRRILDAMQRHDGEIAAAEMRFHIRSVITPRPTDSLTA
jgi:DNA-binding GntR family transcriptional regulator